MPAWVSILAAILGAWGAAQAQPPAPPARLPAPFPEPAVGRIRLTDADGQGLNAATGFWISPTEVVTCWHVARIGRHATILMPDGASHTLTHLLGADERADIAVHRAHPPFDGRTLPLAVGAPPDGTPVRVIGSPGLAEGPPLEGVLQCQRDLEYSGPILDLNMTRGIVVGFSGSPVVDARGRVLGLVNFGMPGKAFGGTAAQIEALRSGSPVPLEEWDRTPLTRFGRANLAMSTALTIEGQRLEEAMRILREAVAESPDCWPAWGHLLANYKGAGDSDAALEAATHAAAGPTAHHSLSLAALLRARGRDDEGAAAEARAARIDPGGLRYIQARDRGMKAMREGRYRDAVPDLSAAVNGDPHSLELWSSVLQCMTQAGYAAQAASDSERLVRRFPTSALAHFTRGVVMAHLRNPVAALKAYRTAADLDPAHAPTHYGLGLLYVALRDFSAAEEELASLRRLDPTGARDLEASIAKARANTP
ncbi:MAG: tetratricopeptide repeat-containing serine protease family protein [Phycisphaerales bacterium]